MDSGSDDGNGNMVGEVKVAMTWHGTVAMVVATAMAIVLSVTMSIMAMQVCK